MRPAGRRRERKLRLRRNSYRKKKMWDYATFHMMNIRVLMCACECVRAQGSVRESGEAFRKKNHVELIFKKKKNLI